MEGDVYGLPTTKVTEFDALGTGGLYLTGLEETVVGSIGTGTVFVHAGPDGIQHIGGSAVGGGTLVGLSSRLFGIRDVEVIADMAEQGNLKNVDWGIAELSRDQMETLPDYATSSNLGKMKSTATDEDVASGADEYDLPDSGNTGCICLPQCESRKERSSAVQQPL